MIAPVRFHHRRLRSACLVPVLLLLAGLACQISPSAGPAAGQASLPVTQTKAQETGSWYAVYFTDPESPTSKSYRGGPGAKLAQAIREARASVDIAVLQLNLWGVRDALLEAHRRGVRVRMVTDSDYIDGEEVQQLSQAGIPVLGDRREGLMHNKFTVIDRLEVWTGSMNYTLNDAYRNNNTLIYIRSAKLAENYTAEFEEMFTRDQFGPGFPANTPNPELIIQGTPVVSCFSPEDGCMERLIQAIGRARKNIAFLAYSFTSDDLAEALIRRAAQGVQVRGVMESSQVDSNAGTDYERFLSAGLDVRLDANPNQMHEKVMIIDGEIVAVGSYNFTYSAETRNDENLLIIENSQISALYQTEFERLYHPAAQGE